MVSLLDDLGWSQAYFARRVGIDPQTVYRWCSGKSKGPGYDVAIAYLELVKRAIG